MRKVNVNINFIILDNDSKIFLHCDWKSSVPILTLLLNCKDRIRKRVHMNLERFLFLISRSRDISFTDLITTKYHPQLLYK